MYNKYLAVWQGSSRRALPAPIQDALSAYFCIVDDESCPPLPTTASTKDLTLYCYDYGTNHARHQADLLNVIPSTSLCLSTHYPHHHPLSNLLYSCHLKEGVSFKAVSSLVKKRLISQPTLQDMYSQRTPRSIRSSHSLGFIVETLAFIDLHLTENLREEDVAEKYGYSTAYFSRSFHQFIGISFREYLCNKRLALAKRLLLEESKFKIAVIAYQCGYHDLSYFNRIFKKKNGISPGQFRQNVLQKAQFDALVATP